MSGLKVFNIPKLERIAREIETGFDAWSNTLETISRMLPERDQTPYIERQANIAAVELCELVVDQRLVEQLMGERNAVAGSVAA